MEITLTSRNRRKQATIAQKAKKKVAAASRATAAKLTWCVAALQGAVLLTFALVPAKMPPNLPLMDLLWAASRRPQFYPLIALLVGGPVLSGLAWQVKGRHRAVLVLFWVTFLTILFTFHMERVRIMLRVLALEYL